MKENTQYMQYFEFIYYFKSILPTFAICLLFPFLIFPSYSKPFCSFSMLLFVHDILVIKAVNLRLMIQRAEAFLLAFL